MRKRSFLFNAIFVAMVNTALMSSVSFADDGSENHPFAPGSSTPDSGSYVVPYARSDSDPTRTETVITIHNQGDSTCQAEVRYYAGISRTPRGSSGPRDLEARQSAEFVTYNEGEVVEPYVANEYRNDTQDFEGYAIVHSDCDKKYLALNATLAIHIDDFDVARSYTSLKVKKEEFRSED